MTAIAKPASGFLGISAKSVDRLDPPTHGAVGRAKFIAKQYATLRDVQSILYDGERDRLAQHRTCYCQRSITAPGESLSVHRSVDGSGARIGGVSTCGSGWTCPICGVRIAARKQKEVAAGMGAHIGAGGYVFLMTLTFPHERDAMPLKETIEKLAAARKVFAQSKTYRRVLSKEVRTGSITALEITRGERHGWHPHTHTLQFLTPDAFGDTTEGDDGRLSSQLIDELKSAWFAALVKAGLCDDCQRSDVLARGLDIRGGQYAAEYVAKFGRDARWGLSREVAMSATKTGGGEKGVHPMQLVEWAAKGDGEAAMWFREYAEAFKGRSMLLWSPGLRKALGLNEVEETDEEAAAAALPEEQVIGSISREGYSLLLSRKMVDAFVAYVAEYCYEPDQHQANIDAFIAYAREHKRQASGTVLSRFWASRQRYAYDPELEAHAA